MGKLVDLTNKKFGRLLVIERNGSTKFNKALWLCLCDCGEFVTVIGSHLMNSNTTSCGCYNKERIGKSLTMDLRNKKIGRLTVIDFYGYNKYGKSMWLCKCDCGNEIIAIGSGILSGNTKSCGCFKIESSKIRGESQIVDCTGVRFDMLYVIGYYGRGNRKIVLWKCLCDCGNEIILSSSKLRTSHSCGCLKESFVSSEMKLYFKKKFNSISEYRECINPRTGSVLPYDFYFEIENRKFYAEINGGQHYKFIPFYHRNVGDFEYQQYKDRIKKKHAKKYGIYIEIDLRKIKTPEEAISYIESFM